VAVTIGTGVVLPHGDGYLDPAFLLLMALVVPAVLAPRTSSRRSQRGFSLLVGGVTLCTLVVTFAHHPGASFGGPTFYWVLGTAAPYVAATVITCSALFMVARRWVQGTALVLLAIPWLILPTIDKDPFGVDNALYVVSIEIACALGFGLIGLWFSRFSRAPESVR
jgi:hypothetical protein